MTALQLGLIAAGAIVVLAFVLPLLWRLLKGLGRALAIVVLLALIGAALFWLSTLK